MPTLSLDLGERSYPIYIDNNLLADSSLLSQHIRGKRVCIVSNELVFPLYGKQLKAALHEFQGISPFVTTISQYY